MKVKNILIACMLISALLYADNNTSDPIDSRVILSQNAEIKALKEKVQKLEAELNSYKKVKPLTLPKKLTQNTKIVNKNISKTDKTKKFVGSKTIPKKLSTYFTAAYQEVDLLKSKLEANGFEVLSVDEILKDKVVLSVTNEALKNTNSFLSVLHILVNKDKEIRLQNPSYFAAAYLKESYKYGDFNETLMSLENVLGDMYEVEEKLVLKDLANYNFMLGMPNFEDSIVVDRGKDIVSKLRREEAKGSISYILTLPNGSVLVGHKLNKKTYEYLYKIDVAYNAQLFPYQVMIRDDKAVMLAPKYYLALSLPLLSMTDFMKIASAPDAIVEDIEEAYNSVEETDQK